jgi:aryl-alcohol dehydrogenase-like predicted oxidoreductase
MNDTAVSEIGPTTVGGAVPRLVLGTVQFGYPYGISQSRVERAEVGAMLARAWAHGVDMLDTAPVYGDSEAIIGAEKPASADFRFVSKTKALRLPRITAADVERVVARARTSVADLRAVRLDAILVHESEDLVCPGSDLLVAGLRGLCAEGLVSRVGVSVYDPDILALILERHQIDIVQLPMNLLDQRFVRDRAIARLAARGIEVHARSVFLQGLLLQPAGEVPARFAGAEAVLQRFRADAAANGLSPAEAAILFAVGQEGVARLVVGVDSIANLDANVRALDKVAKMRGIMDFAQYALDDPQITDPRRWTS